MLIGGHSCCMYFVRNPLVEKEALDATASFFVAKVRAEVFAYFHAVAVERHIRMRVYFVLVLETGLCLLSNRQSQ
jgi:hypothetical protein